MTTPLDSFARFIDDYSRLWQGGHMIPSQVSLDPDAFEELRADVYKELGDSFSVQPDGSMFVYGVTVRPKPN